MTDYEQLLTIISGRRSIRRFSEFPLSRDDILRLLEAARWAPSNHNRQPWRFIVLENRGQIARLARAIGVGLSRKLELLPESASAYRRELAHYATFFSAAPVLLVALHKLPVSLSAALLEGVPNPTLVSGEPLSVAMAVQNLLLAAHALGLGACVLTAPLVATDVVTRELDMPAGYDLTCFIAVGHPAEAPAPPRRKTLEQIVEFRNNPPESEAGPGPAR